MKFKYLLPVLILVLACNAGKYADDTRIFNDYLKKYVHTSIPKDTVYWIVISESGCEGCIGKTVTKLKDNRKAMFLVNINSYYSYLQPKNVSPDKYLVDTTDRIKRLKYHQHNVGIIQTANKKIYNIIYLAYNETDSVLSTIR